MKRGDERGPGRYSETGDGKSSMSEREVRGKGRRKGGENGRGLEIDGPFDLSFWECRPKGQRA